MARSLPSYVFTFKKKEKTNADFQIENTIEWNMCMIHVKQKRNRAATNSRWLDKGAIFLFLLIFMACLCTYVLPGAYRIPQRWLHLIPVKCRHSYYATCDTHSVCALLYVWVFLFPLHTLHAVMSFTLERLAWNLELVCFKNLLFFVH